MKHINNKTGYSLVETTVTVGIFSMLIVAFISFFTWTVTTYNKLQAMDRVIKNLNIALSTMVYEVREAQSIYYPTSSSTQISLKTRHNPPDNEEFAFVDIYLCGASICIKRDGQAVEQLTSSLVEVTDLQFTQVSTSTAPSVYINMSLRNAGYVSGRSDTYYQLNFHSAATLRSL